MRINADFDQPALLDTAAMPWVASPMAGVERKMLDRIGGEIARATSLVRYAPGSSFSAHSHDGGEEFLVLEGVFSDEHGDYPAGTYVRNPIGTRHTPFSEQGCVILVKLHQFAPDDLAQFAIDWHCSDNATSLEPGVSTWPLHAHGSERVRIERWQAGAAAARPGQPGGLEMFVIEGSLSVGNATLVAGGWLRLPPGASFSGATSSGCELYVKHGHLASLADLPDAAALP